MLMGYELQNIHQQNEGQVWLVNVTELHDFVTEFQAIL